MLVLLVVARAVDAWHVPLPACGFKTLTGWPCAFCGTTRAALAAARFDFAGAAQLNPLACALGVAVVVGFVAWASDRWLSTDYRRWLRRAASPPWLWLGGAVLVLNWLYLLVTVPR